MEIDDLFDFKNELLDEELSLDGELSQISLERFNFFFILVVNFEILNCENIVESGNLIFNCSGETSLVEGAEAVFMKDLQALLNHQALSCSKEVELFNFSFDDELPVDILIQMALANVQKLLTSTPASYNNRTTFFSIRESVTKLLLILRCNVHDLR